MGTRERATKRRILELTRELVELYGEHANLPRLLAGVRCPGTEGGTMSGRVRDKAARLDWPTILERAKVVVPRWNRCGRTIDPVAMTRLLMHGKTAS